MLSRSDRVAVALLFLLGLLASTPLAAQRWTVGTGSSAVSVEAVSGRGYPVLPISVLTALGGEVEVRSGEAQITLGSSRITVRPGSPFFMAGDRLQQLVHPVYQEGGTVFLPLQFFVDHLPRLEPGAVATSIPDRTIGRPTATAEAAPAAAPPQAERPRTAVETAPPAQPAARPPVRPAGSTDARRLVVIDAGHGGVDPGAVGPGGTREKDITLAVAQRLAAILREDPRYEVRMTRDRDTLIALTDRTRMANGWRMDGQPAVFMSIHTNAANSRSVAGFETFFLSEARTEDARRVAEMENAAQRFESPETKLDPLSFIMHDLRQNRYLRDSSDWAAMIQRRIGEIHSGPNRGVKQAGFVVLYGAYMPAVLVELGFISNPREELMMTRPNEQQRMAQQLARGVHDFFDRPDPTGAR